MTSKNNFSFSDSFIEEYDLFGKVFPFHDELQGTIAEELESHFQNVENKSDLVFLDIGAGYGFTTQLVAQKFPNAKFLLNEYGEDLINRADDYLKEYNYEKKIGDIEEVIKTIPDNSVDAVYTAWVLHNFPPEKRKVIYDNVARILKKGGAFIALEKIGDNNKERESHLAQALIDLSPFVTKHKRPDLFLEWVRHNLRDEEPDLLFSDKENEQLLNQNNFEWKYVKHILLEKIFTAVKK